ncbi:MAG: SurA N-terminal domain-containing protein [Rhodospirillales bacterium]|jgi:peptidyl-prolyl cis-trans isomerase D|nr:SurA N-terminal domain-containing protein [Rhodospirillales bacterium]
MLTAFRRALETWPVRMLFGLMVIAFVVWGVGDAIRNIGTTTWIAKVGGQTIDPARFNEVFERDLALAEQRLPQGQNVTAALRRKVAQAALDQMIAQAAISEEIRRLRIAVPDSAVRETVFAMPAFQGPGGTFDRARMNAVLANNGISENRFLGMISGQIAQQQMLGAVVAGVAPPALLTRKLFSFSAETRSALVAPVPFASAPPPPAPDEAALQRFYADHPWLYRVPEYREIKAVVLTAGALAKAISVTPEELKTYYDEHKADYVTPERRSLQVLVLHDAAKAAALAKQWQGGADWAAMQAAAKADGGNAVALPGTTEGELPDPALAKAAFAAAQGVVTGPVTTGLGVDVVKVTKITAGAAKSLADVKDEVAARVRADHAANRIYDVANKVDNILGTGVGLSKLPGDVGLVGVSGTLDAGGTTPKGKPAPIPGPPALRKAIVKAAFATAPGQPPAQLTEVAVPGGGTAYYALTVEKVTPPREKPFSEVKDTVTAQWTAAKRRKEAERIATRVLVAVQGGQTFATAAAAAGLAVQATPLLARQGPAGEMPAVLRRVLFSLKPGQPTMVQSDKGFLLAVPQKIVQPDPKQEPEKYAALRQVIARAVSQDVASSFAAALRQRAHPRVDHAQLESFVNSGN